MKLLALLFLLFVPAASAWADPISAGLAAIGSAVGASAGAAVMTGLMVTGTALSAVGALTGSKRLMKLGGLVSLAGGVGAGLQALSAAAGSVAEGAATSAGAEALSQTPSAVAGEVAGEAASTAIPTVGEALAQTPVAQELTGAAAAAPSSGLVDAATAGVPQGGLPSGMGAAAGSQAVAAPANPVAQALATASKHVGSFIKDNKELVKLGSGLIVGAMNRSGANAQQQAEIDYQNQRRADYNAGIQGSTVPFRIQGGQDVTNVDPRDPVRFIPQRGLVNANTTPTGG